MRRAGISNEALAEKLGVHETTVSKWRTGSQAPDREMVEQMSAVLDLHPAWLEYGAGDPVPRGAVKAIVSEPRAPDYEPGWPKGWRSRTYRLQLEAEQVGATDEEIAIVRGWMLDSQLQALWSGGAPKDLKELDGIEIGARAWLRARGRMVKAR